MNVTGNYIEAVFGFLEKLRAEEAKLDAAADIMAQAVKKDGLIHLFGTDPHSASAGDELFFKGGGLANINPFYDPAFSFAHGAYRCSLCQNLDGLAPVVMEYYKNAKAGDPIIIIGERPEALVFSQAIEKAAEMKLSVIVITSMDGAAIPDWASRVDVLIDNQAPRNDCVLTCGGRETAGVAALLTGAILNLLAAKTLERAATAPVWGGSGTATSADKPMIFRFLERIRHL